MMIPAALQDGERTARRSSRGLLAAGLATVLCLLVGCGAVGAADETVPAEVVASPVEGAEGLDALTLTVRLPRTSVRPGGELVWTYSVRNDSDRPVTDPACHLGQSSAAIAPRSEPDVDLWQRVVVDCSGPFTMKPGFAEQRTGSPLVAATKFGDPLPAGEYVAVIALRDVSQRFEIPVEVSAD